MFVHRGRPLPEFAYHRGILRVDSNTEGSWKGIDGLDGVAVVNDSTSYPAYAQVTLSGLQPFTWASSTSDIRALQKSAINDRIASAWFASSPFTIDINLSDGNVHQVALYCLDMDLRGRAETISVTDSATIGLFDTQTVSSFTSGKYFIWNVNGHVKFTITRTAGPNGVVSGLFFR
jgi:hypothetical protein